MPRAACGQRAASSAEPTTRAHARAHAPMTERVVCAGCGGLCASVSSAGGCRCSARERPPDARAEEWAGHQVDPTDANVQGEAAARLATACGMLGHMLASHRVRVRVPRAVQIPEPPLATAAHAVHCGTLVCACRGAGPNSTPDPAVLVHSLSTFQPSSLAPPASPNSSRSTSTSSTTTARRATRTSASRSRPRPPSARSSRASSSRGTKPRARARCSSASITPSPRRRSFRCGTCACAPAPPCRPLACTGADRTRDLQQAMQFLASVDATCASADGQSTPALTPKLCHSR